MGKNFTVTYCNKAKNNFFIINLRMHLLWSAYYYPKIELSKKCKQKLRNITNYFFKTYKFQKLDQKNYWKKEIWNKYSIEG